jgi:hypothetical protein
MARWSLLVVLLSTLAAVCVVADPCSSFTSCGECRNSSFVCHWCKDRQCHAKASIHGCVYGTYCYDNDQCQRDAPQFKGYALPSFGALLGVCLVGGTIAMCAIAAIVLARDFAKQEEDELEFDMGYYALSDDSDEVSSMLMCTCYILVHYTTTRALATHEKHNLVLFCKYAKVVTLAMIAVLTSSNSILGLYTLNRMR